MADVRSLDAERAVRAITGSPTDRPPSPYDTLDAAKIVSTTKRLSRRVSERFPESGLAEVSDHLVHVAEDAHQTARWIARPILSLRVATVVCIAMIVIGVGVSIWAVDFGSAANVAFVDFVAAVEAGINDVVLIGAAIFFLVTLETRIKRNRALNALHRLRSLAHIIDMHQLTKSPERIQADHLETASSPHYDMNAFELGRYLDYCSELLSITGKIAAIYIQDFEDGVALAAVNEIEDLTSGLSRKVWQKLIILRATEEAMNE